MDVAKYWVVWIVFVYFVVWGISTDLPGCFSMREGFVVFQWTLRILLTLKRKDSNCGPLFSPKSRFFTYCKKIIEKRKNELHCKKCSLCINMQWL